MRRTILLTATLLTASLAPAQQVIQLFSENFNAAGNLFSLNTTSLGGPSGVNEWIVNNEYIGAPNYPNTISQDSVVAGNITGAPYSRYLHIHDKNNAQKNANWNTSSGADNFVEISGGFCTKAMTDVKIAFFWLCEGNPNAYGEFYYSINGGAWTKTGQAKYNSQYNWQYELLQDPAWEDQEDVRFGFRWVNQSGGTENASFAIDDVIAVGTYDEINNPVTVTITNVAPNPVCRDGGLIVFYSLSDTLCFGQYMFQLSNANCNFSSAVNLGFINLGPVASGAVIVTIPAATPAGACYCVRMVRVAPLPIITGNSSACFEVLDCPIVITTLRPVVTIGTGNGEGDSMCIKSVIDVPFNSGPGVFNADNVYTAQLSDTNGDFDTPPAPFFIGSKPDQNNYPAIPPGTVSGLIPTVPPGCGYYVRVISSSPPVIGAPWGPFCIKECDLTTNHTQDIQLCIDELNGDSAEICVDEHTWTTNAQYFINNEFTIEVHSSMNFAIIPVNPPGLGATFDTTTACFTIYAPPLAQLAAMGLAPGMYYIRIIASDGSLTYDLLGSLVRLTIGAPSAFPPVAINPDSVICTNDISCFTVSPYNFQSKYQWHSPTVNGGQPFMWPGSTLCINFNNSSGTFVVRVRELNNGCWGPWSGYAELLVLGPPGVSIVGPIRVCVGEIVSFQVPFAEHTYFEWDASGGIISDTTNSVADIYWTAPGQYMLSVGVVNPCAADTGFKLITVIPYPVISAGPDTTICTGEPVTLNATGIANGFQWIEPPAPTVISNTNQAIVNPIVTTVYTVTASNNIGSKTCLVEETVTVQVLDPVTTTDSLVMCDNGKATLDATQDVGPYPNGTTYLWSTGATTQTIEVVDGADYSVEISVPGEICARIRYFPVHEKVCNELIFIPNAFSPNDDGDNDFFYVVGTNSEFIELRIYNRWGELLYTTTDIKAGWDGTYKGMDAPIGVYTYVCRFLDLEDKEQIASGNVSLLR